MLHTRFEQYYDIVQTTKEYAIYRLTTLNDYHKDVQNYVCILSTKTTNSMHEN